VNDLMDNIYIVCTCT